MKIFKLSKTNILNLVVTLLLVTTLTVLGAVNVSENKTNLLNEIPLEETATTTNSGLQVSNNSATQNGGGIYNAGTINQYKGNIDNNSANRGAGIYNTSAGVVNVEELEAGLYDENWNLVKSWDELVNNYGLNIEINYTSSTYETDTASMYYILTNNSELEAGAKLIISESINSIGKYAFCACTGITSITIPDSVTSIGTSAFESCTDLTSVTIPNSVTSIGGFAFRSSGLKSIVIPRSMTSIGPNTLAFCRYLTSVTIPNSITSIGTNAFEACTSLTSVVIPNSVTSVDNGAFRNCAVLAHITIPNSITSIGTSVFDSCKKLTSIVVDENNPVYDSRNNCNAIIETATNTLISGCKNTIIPDSVTSIGNNAFFYHTDLKSITIPNSVTYIGKNAFQNCTGLTSVYFEHTTVPKFDQYCFNKSNGDICTFYFKNGTVANALTTSHYNKYYGTKSTNYDW